METEDSLHRMEAWVQDIQAHEFSDHEKVAPLVEEAEYMLDLYRHAIEKEERPIYREHEIREVLGRATEKLNELSNQKQHIKETP